MVRTRLAVLVGLVAWALPAATAHGYVHEGAPWPTHTITYFDAGPNPGAVRAAVTAWNTSGAGVRFVATSRQRAHVLILPLAPRGCVGLEGFATLGYDPAGDVVHLRSCPDRYIAAAVAAHELGHVLGLGHETHVCATMNPSVEGLCGTPPAYFQECRILQVDDVRGAVRIYGGRVRPIRAPQFCPEFSAPAPPTSVSVTGTAPPAQMITALVRIRPEHALVTLPAPTFNGITFRQPPPQLTAAVYRYANACPQGKPHGHPAYEQSLPGSGGQARVYLDARAALAPGRWCYAVWTTDSAGRRSPRATTATVTITHQAPTASFDAPQGATAGYQNDFYDTSSPGDDAIVSWQWNFGDGGTSTSQNPSYTYAQPGTYTVTLTVTASDGQTSTTSQQIDVAPDGGGY